LRQLQHAPTKAPSSTMDATYNMDVDDLFGDSEHVTLGNINATPPVKGLAKRIDELGASGCCQ
jgi:mediator of RNA polymerase II transcription subunit 16